MKISLKDFATDGQLGLRQQARAINIAFLDDAKGAVELDFAGIKLATSAFIDELLGGLIEEHGFEWFLENIHMSNVNDSIKAVVRATLAVRWKTEREEGDEVA